ncbi:MAG: radical SAM domain-containing protein [Promethearchaeota archaeon CR_4]|nr:MAG: radical SAM domain-containing protein [Candidatus Lokiarchaeota archaeon CR_4]
MLTLDSQICSNNHLSFDEAELVIEITKFCPQYCLFCSSNAGPSQNYYMRLSQIIDIMNEAESLKFRSIHLSGGEPLSHPEIGSILDILIKKNFKKVIYTCGLVNKSKKISSLPEGLINKISRIRNCVVRFNFQTLNEENFEIITQRRNSFRFALKSIQLCLDYGIQTEVHIVPTLLNLNDLEKTISFLLNIGVKKVKILRFIPQGRGKQNQVIVDPSESSEKFYEILLSIIKAFPPSLVEIGSAFSCLGNANNSCTAGIKKFAITPENILFPCVAFKSTLGIPLDKNSLQEVIQRYDFVISLKEIIQNKCQICVFKEICKEICPMQVLLCKQFQIPNNEQLVKVQKRLENQDCVNVY